MRSSTRSGAAALGACCPTASHRRPRPIAGSRFCGTAAAGRQSTIVWCWIASGRQPDGGRSGQPEHQDGRGGRPARLGCVQKDRGPQAPSPDRHRWPSARNQGAGRPCPGSRWRRRGSSGIRTPLPVHQEGVRRRRIRRWAFGPGEQDHHRGRPKGSGPARLRGAARSVGHRRFFGWITRNRRLYRDVEAGITSAKAFLYVAAVMILGRRLDRNRFTLVRRLRSSSPLRRASSPVR